MQTVILPALAQPNLLWFNSSNQLNYRTFFFSQCNYNIVPIEPYRVNVTIHTSLFVVVDSY